MGVRPVEVAVGVAAAAVGVGVVQPLHSSTSSSLPQAAAMQSIVITRAARSLVERMGRAYTDARRERQCERARISAVAA